MARVFCFAHTSTANKTQYVPMAIMRVFWGCCLVPELRALYHEVRTAPSKNRGANVGWDMLVEWLNAAIKSHVTSHITPEPLFTGDDGSIGATELYDGQEQHSNAREGNADAHAHGDGGGLDMFDESFELMPLAHDDLDVDVVCLSHAPAPDELLPAHVASLYVVLCVHAHARTCRRRLA